MSWPGLDSALNELDMLSTVTSGRKEYLREKLERQRIHANNQAGTNSEYPSTRSTERPLQPSQAWNMPGTAGNLGAVGWGWSPEPADIEDNENKFRFDASSRLKAVPSRIGVIPNVIHLNPGFISSLGLHLDLSESGAHRRSCPARLAQLSAASHRQHHLKPYNIPWRREERVRTKSENADSEAAPTAEAAEMAVGEVPELLVPPPTPLFRSRSLEDVRSPHADMGELDEVSLEIQRLHVNE